MIVPPLAGLIGMVSPFLLTQVVLEPSWDRELVRSVISWASDNRPIVEDLGRQRFAFCQEQKSFNRGLFLILAIGHVETRWRRNILGASGERGPLQVWPVNYRMLGFSKKRDLMTCLARESSCAIRVAIIEFKHWRTEMKKTEKRFKLRSSVSYWLRRGYDLNRSYRYAKWFKRLLKDLNGYLWIANYNWGYRIYTPDEKRFWYPFLVLKQLKRLCGAVK